MGKRVSAMESIYNLKTIAHIQSDFTEKFGIPRQSGLIEGLQASIIFEPDYRATDALRGLDGYSHIWLIWGFSEAVRKNWSPTVRPPRLGGNQRMGVFATRSPFRPNPLGLSCVRLDGMEAVPEYGTILHVSGADLLNGTPIFDIKPYLPYVDSHPEAVGGFGDSCKDYKLEVDCPPECLQQIPGHSREVLFEILAQDPRPSYQNDPTRIYGMNYAGMNIKFYVDDKTLHICKIDAAKS